MEWKSFLHVTLKQIRESDIRPYHALVVASAFSLATAFGFWIHKFLLFQPHTSEIIGWISANNYPKHQEFLYYLLALIGIPAATFIYTLFWIILSQFVAKWVRQPTTLLLKQNALASSFLLLTWYRIWDLNRNPLFGLLLPMTLVLITKIGIIGIQLRKKNEATPTLPIEETKRKQICGHITDNRIFGHPIFRIFKYLILPVLIYSLIYSGHGSSTIDLFHEGEQLAPLNEMVRGNVPFRDIYLQHGLFQNAGLAWLGGKIFGVSLEGVRKMSRLLAPCGYVAIYLLGTQLFCFSIIPSIFLTLIISSEGNWVTARHSLALISFAWVANYLKTHHHDGLYAGWNSLKTTAPSPGLHSTQNTENRVRQQLRDTLEYSITFGWKLITAGFFANLAFWYSTEIGLYTLGSINIFLLIYGVRREIPKSKQLLPLGCYNSGALIGSLPILTYFTFHGALDDLIANTWIQCRYQIPTWGLRFPSLSSVLEPLNNPAVQNQWIVFLKSEGFRWYLPIVSFVVVASYLVYRSTHGRVWNSEGCSLLFLTLMGGAAFFRTALGRSDGGHLIFGSTFLWVIGILIIERGIARIIRQKTDRAWVTIFICVLSAGMFYYLQEVHHPVRAFSSRVNQFMNRNVELVKKHPILNRIGRENIQTDQAEHIARVVAYIQNHTQPNERIFDFTSQGAYYFFANRLSATRYHQVAYASTPSMQMEVTHDLKKNETNLVIFKTGGWFDRIDGIPSEQRHPIIAQYLKEHYKLAVNINGTQILNRM